MSLTKLSFICLFSSISAVSFSTVLAADLAGACQNAQAVILDEKSEGLSECQKAVIGVKADPNYEKKFRSKLNEKLSKIVALQTKQAMEDLSLSSMFYEQQDQPFLLSDEMKSSCRFDFIAQIEKNGCDGKSITNEEKENLKLVAESLNENKNQSSSLMDSLIHVYGESKYGHGFDETHSNQCPLNGNASTLNAQITTFSALAIIENVTSNLKAMTAADYQKYPQIAMINEASKFDPTIKEKFEKYLKGFNKKDDPKEFLIKFFLNKENSKILGKGVARRCAQVRSSISSFVCHPLSKFTTENAFVSSKLLNGFDPSLSYSDQDDDVKNDDKDKLAFTAYALSCEEKASTLKNNFNLKTTSTEKNKTSIEADCLNLQANDYALDNMFNCFSEGIHPERSKVSLDETVKRFCDRFMCKSADVINLNSCKAGGPLTSVDLAQLDSKNAENQKAVSFLQNFERQTLIKNNFLADSKNQSTENKTTEDKAKRSLSEFDMNAFGAEGVTKLTGLPANTQTIAMVSQEMKDKGIQPSTPEEVQKIVNRSSFENAVAAGERGGNQNNENYAPVVAANTTYQTTNNNHYAPIESRETVKEKTKTNTPFIGGSDKAETNAETEQMMKDLKTLMDESKKTNDSKNSSSAKAIESTPAKEAGKSAYDNELRSWASSLASRDSDLRTRENLANMRDAEYWKKYDELRRKESDLAERAAEEKKSRQPASVDAKAAAPRSSITQSMNEVKAAKAKLDQDLSATPAGLTVTAERLEKLNKEDLKENNVNTEEPFVISVRLRSKLIHVRVAKLKDGSHTYLAPYLNEDNMEVKEAILKSPIFKEFRYFLEQKETAYSPVKKVRK
jgi:hypothetical protein